jgi:hypothetical protein
MHVNDIKAFANKVSLDEQYTGKKVVIKAKSPHDDSIKYMTMTGFDSEKREDAFEFRYTEDNVGSQVMTLAMQGITIEVEAA